MWLLLSDPYGGSESPGRSPGHGASEPRLWASGGGRELQLDAGCDEVEGPEQLRLRVSAPVPPTAVVRCP